MVRNLFILIQLTFLSIATYAQVILDLEIDHIRNSEGVIRLAVYTKSSEFPKSPAFTHIIKKDSLQNHKIRARICSFHPGVYAFSLLDDENNNDAMDYNALRIPVEGFGFSCSSKPFLRAPPYKKCIVELKAGKNKL
ncbi:MAG: DUF2141 domain-containing protein, partial [Bacteroidales bacterium]|nr:DUF2141 domain-containing protein [Bacteroidales bacterium]